MAKICARCKKYEVVLVADKDQPSKYCEIAPQSDSEAEHWSYMTRWIYAYPIIETDHCYYCTKVLNGQIKKAVDYGFGYEAKQTPMWSIGSSSSPAI